jgi:hypothetical protein
MSFDAPKRPGLAAKQLVASCLAIGIGGVLLGLQVDGNGELVGTGLTPLGVGAVAVLVAMLLGSWRSLDVPRDPVTTLSAFSGFLGLAFAVSGVLAPGGGWMFFEVLVLAAALSRSNTRSESLSRGALALLVLFLLFRLWISYQGSRHRWEVIAIDVPILSSIPFDFLEPIQQVSLGSFTPRELGFPPAGLDFAPSLALWASGFVLCVVGLAWRARAAHENENDRVHEAIHELPPMLAALVERLLPEEQWRELGLHGLSDRRLRKRIEQLVVERVAARRELERVLASRDLLASTNPGGFTGEIYRALTGGG